MIRRLFNCAIANDLERLSSSMSFQRSLFFRSLIESQGNLMKNDIADALA